MPPQQSTIGRRSSQNHNKRMSFCGRTVSPAKARCLAQNWTTSREGISIQEAGEINKIGYDRLRATYNATPQLYGLPKIHKPEVPLRPIVSSIDSPTYNLAKFLTRIISPLADKTSTFVQDSGDFVEKARSIDRKKEVSR